MRRHDPSSAGTRMVFLRFEGASAGTQPGSWSALPYAVRDVPLLGMAADELLDLAQQLLRHAQLVRVVVAAPLRDDQRHPLHLVRVVGQPVDAYRKERRPHPQGE